MKFLGIIFITISMLFGCGTTETKENHDTQPQKLTKEQLHKLLISRYQVIAGAWYINNNCSFLSPVKSSLLEKHVGGLNVYAQKNRLLPTQHLYQMQSNARLGASLPKYSSCGEEAKNLVAEADVLSTMLFEDLVAK